MEGWNFWWGIAAFFLGGLATQLNGWLAYRRQRKDRADDATAALRQRREEFELQHLVEVNQLLRDCMASRVSALFLRWSNELQPDDQVTAEKKEEQKTAERTFTAARAKLQSQVGFVLDDQLRQKVEDATEIMSNFGDESAATTDRAGVLLHMHHVVSAAHATLTARVRALYAGRAGS
ncbi:hypothetical protein [Streptomyces parvulus]|uniref:hypothetical protein n=1 Tax=Streptomyces parvulus TaxID=146923 RepID=UPI0033F62F50